MYSIDDIKVTLINKDEVKEFIKKHGEVATVCYNTPIKYAEKVGLSCLNSGHLSGSRGNYFLFEIECPRYTADQIMRHEVGVFKNCQSQRYVDIDKIEIYVSPRVMKDSDLRYHYKHYEELINTYYKGIINDASKLFPGKINDLVRTLLPIGVKCTLRIGFTLEALINFCGKRLCMRADEVIRRVAILMRDEVLSVEPRYSDYLKIQCESMLFCPEKETCGYKPKKDDLEKIYKDFYNNK